MSEIQDNQSHTASHQSGVDGVDTHAESTDYHSHLSLPIDIQQVSEYHAADESEDGGAEADDEADDEADGEADDEAGGGGEGQENNLGIYTESSSLQFYLSSSSEESLATSGCKPADPFFWGYKVPHKEKRAYPKPLKTGYGGNFMVVGSIPSSSSPPMGAIGSVQAAPTEGSFGSNNGTVILMVDNSNFLIKWLKDFWGAVLKVFWRRGRE